MSFTVAVVGLAGLAWLAWVLLGLAGYRHHGPPALHDTVAVLQLVFATVAGVGALVALIVAYRRQKIAEADSVHDRTRVFNERFTAIATQLGDAQPAVRLAGVHAMAGLADDWKQSRLRFGGEVIGRNDPGYQEKIVKFNELLANCVIYQNACDITAAANALAADGHPVDPDDLATIVPYITHTIRRFGDWVLDLSPPQALPVTALNLAPGALFPGGRFDPYPG